MKELNSRILSAFMALLLMFSLLSGITFTADAATVDYQYGNTDKYSNVIINWGTREEIATFLSPNAEEFYADTTYEELAALDGSSDLNVVNTSALYVALYELMSNAHTTKNSYKESNDLFQYTDCQNNGSVDSGKISTFYSGTLAGPEWDSGATFTREHTWPDSMGGSADTTDSTRTNESDMMMLRPIPQSENSSRSNTPYGKSNDYYYPNLGSNDVRGDAARTILYVYVRWGNEQSAVLDNIWNVFESKEVLLDWMEADPVDTWEMGRNDSVQSITGTRNVFVDYPELAFALFNEEIPEMVTPSGNAGSAGYTITAKSNNTSYGTVSVSGNIITATPSNGYYAAGYTVTSGSATVTQNGNVFTVKTTADCAITINFALAPKYTVQIKENGILKSTQSVQANTSFTLPALSSALPENHTFVGWSATEVSDADKKPNVYAAGEKVTVTANTTFHAVVAVLDPTVQGGTKTWTLVTNNSQISAGSEVIIAAAEYDKAMGSLNSSGNNFLAVDVAKTESTLTFDSSVGVKVFALETGTISGSYAFCSKSVYLYAVNSSSNYLREKSSLADDGSFYITVNGDGTCTITSAAYVSSAANVGNVPMQYNTSGLFACYPKATQKALSLYVAVSGNGATTYTTSWETGSASCPHTNTTTTTIPATCTEPGSKTVSCTACGEVISTTVLPAGHTEVEKEIPATLTQQGYTLLYCGVCSEELGKENYSNPLTDVESWNLTLGSDVTVNFKINVHDSIRNTAKIHIGVGGSTKTYAASELTAESTVSVNMAAAMMTEPITVYITNGTDKSQEKTYTIKSYAQSILNSNEPETTKNLVKQMLHYGAAAQIYFGYRTNDLANAGIPAVTHTAPETTNRFTSSGSVDGIEFHGASLVFRDRIALRYYYNVSGSISDYTFTVNGKTLQPKEKGGRYYVEIADINPQDLGTAVTVKVNNVLSVTYSPLNYLVNINQSGTADLQLLVQTLYGYHQAAKAYIG